MAKKSNKVVNYFKDVKSEMKKVVWPSFKQVKNNTLIVIICVLIIGAFIWICDALFANSIGRVVDKLQGEPAVEDTVDKDAEQQELSQEEILEYQKQYLKTLGIDFDGTTYKDADGNVLTEEQVNEIVSAAQAEAENAPEAENTEENKDAE